MISFILDINPFTATHHAKRIVRIGRFSRLADKPELTKAINTYESLLLPYKPESPQEGAVSLKLTFCFPFNKSASKKFRSQIRPKITKPDCSNLAKTFEDCLCRMGFFHDDGQVYKLTVEKYFSSLPGIGVRIE